MTEALLPIIEVRCVFCPHIERAVDPYAAGAQMELHYDKRHQQRIDGIVGARTNRPAHASRPDAQVRP